jgi:hypothetical protein
MRGIVMQGFPFGKPRGPPSLPLKVTVGQTSRRNKQTKNKRKNMKATQAQVNQAAHVCNVLWDITVDSVNLLATEVAKLMHLTGESPSKAGELVGAAWKAESLDSVVESSKPIRLLAEAARDTNMTKDTARSFLKGTGLVSRQRVHQILAVVFDGDKAANKGSRKAPKGEPSVKTVLTASGPAPKGATPAAPTPAKADFKAVVAVLKGLTSLTREQAIEIAKLAASKVK